MANKKLLRDLYSSGLSYRKRCKESGDIAGVKFMDKKLKELKIDIKKPKKKKAERYSKIAPSIVESAKRGLL